MSETQTERLQREIAASEDTIIVLVDRVGILQETLLQLLEIHGHPDDQVIQAIREIAEKPWRQTRALKTS